MSFIGIICDGRNEKNIKQTLKHKLQDKTIIFLNEQSIENLKNITFETIIIMSKQERIFNKKEMLKSIISKVKYLVINADENLDILEDIDINVITYGFNSKSTITASSVKDDNILLCIQRTIENLFKKPIEPQEIIVKKINQNLTTSLIMGIATILLIYEKNDFTM